MDRYELNIEQSKRVYEDCKPYIEFKMCYNNVFNVPDEQMYSLQKLDKE